MNYKDDPLAQHRRNMENIVASFFPKSGTEAHKET
jgi:hypothetical protein